MSAERELLKECRLMLDNPINGTAGRNLQIRITELLAQPEQIEQEPVVKITSIHADGENLPVAITGVVLSDAVNIWDLPIKNNELLFLAPPKREPIEDKFDRVKSNREFYQAGYAEAELKLKREPLSDDEILNLYKDFSKTTFVELVRQIEKAHGITGGEE